MVFQAVKSVKAAETNSPTPPCRTCPHSTLDSELHTRLSSVSLGFTATALPERPHVLPKGRSFHRGKAPIIDCPFPEVLAVAPW